MKLINQAPISKGTKVLVRCDLDVTFKKGGEFNTYRLDKGLKTLKYIIEQGGLPIICGHLGKPKGEFSQELSTKNLIPYFNENLGSGNYEILENLRFDTRETENNTEFAEELASKANIFVNECFATSHREHSSIVGIPKILPSYAGFRLDEEITNLTKIFNNPPKPFVAVVGGIKLESKKPAVLRLLNIADKVLVGGKIGEQWDEDIPSNLLLPTDYEGDLEDIGKNTVESFSKEIKEAKTILWAGPVGKYEDERFKGGTRDIAYAIVESQAYTIAGGGDTVSAVEYFNLMDKFDFISTGGGAMLEFIIKETLIGISALEN